MIVEDCFNVSPSIVVSLLAGVYLGMIVSASNVVLYGGIIPRCWQDKDIWGVSLRWGGVNTGVDRPIVRLDESSDIRR